MNIKKLLSFYLLLFLFVISASILPPLVNAAIPTAKDPVVQQILNIAQQKLNAEYDVLTTGDAAKLTQPMAQVSGVAEQQANTVATVQLRRNRALVVRSVARILV